MVCVADMPKHSQLGIAVPFPSQVWKDPLERRRLQRMFCEQALQVWRGFLSDGISESVPAVCVCVCV